MVEEYNLDRVGKKMPFTMPDGFFEQMQANVLAEVEKEEQAKRHSKAMVKRIYMAVASMAACVCLVFLVGGMLKNVGSEQQTPASMASVDKAYDSLSSEEQQELNATYANDVYLCME